MAISACLVTKPGGLTLSEGLAAGLPIFIYRPVAGQERRNAEYLARRGAADIVYRSSELASSIMKLMADPDRLIERRHAASAIASYRSSETLVMDFVANLSIMKETAPAAPAANAPKGAIFRSQ